MQSLLLMPLELQQALGIPMVEVWLGWLLAGFRLEQSKEFYKNIAFVIKMPGQIRQLGVKVAV